MLWIGLLICETENWESFHFFADKSCPVWFKMFAFNHTFCNMTTQNHDLQRTLFKLLKKYFFIDLISIELQDLNSHENNRYQKRKYHTIQCRKINLTIRNTCKAICLWHLKLTPLFKQGCHTPEEKKIPDFSPTVKQMFPDPAGWQFWPWVNKNKDCSDNF